MFILKPGLFFRILHVLSCNYLWNTFYDTCSFRQLPCFFPFPRHFFHTSGFLDIHQAWWLCVRVQSPLWTASLHKTSTTLGILGSSLLLIFSLLLSSNSCCLFMLFGWRWLFFLYFFVPQQLGNIGPLVTECWPPSKRM